MIDSMTSNDNTCKPKWGWARKLGGGPPWMKGGPFAGGPFGGPPFGPFAAKRTRMFAQGDLPLLLLALIADQPSHGYDLTKTIEARFGGNYAPSPGAMYPKLTQLEKDGLIEPESDDGQRKTFRATEKGREHLADHAGDVKALMARIEVMAGAASSGFPPSRVMQAIMTLRHAIIGKPGGWTKEEEQRVADILEDAAKKIVAGGK